MLSSALVLELPSTISFASRLLSSFPELMDSTAQNDFPNTYIDPQLTSSSSVKGLTKYFSLSLFRTFVLTELSSEDIELDDDELMELIEVAEDGGGNLMRAMVVFFVLISAAVLNNL